MDTQKTPNVLHVKPKVDDYREASIQLLQQAQSQLARVIAGLESPTVDFEQIGLALADFYTLENLGVGAAVQYAKIVDCDGSS